MTIKPIRYEYPLGHDIHRRPSRLIGERQSNGAMAWTIVSAPVNQRDEGARMDSLTTEQLRMIGDIAQDAQANGVK